MATERNQVRDSGRKGASALSTTHRKMLDTASLGRAAGASRIVAARAGLLACVLNQNCRIPVRASALSAGKISCTRHASRMSLQPQFGAAGSKVTLHVAFLDEDHSNSRGTVASLEGARLERSLDCRRREGESLLIRAYTRNGSRAGCVSATL